MKWKHRLLVLLLLLAVVPGIVAADHVAVSWWNQPPATVDPGDTIEVDAYVSTNEEVEVRLKQKRSWTWDKTLETKTVQSSQFVSLETDTDELGLSPGDSANLYVEVEETSKPWNQLTYHDDSTSTKTVTVNDDPPSVDSWSTDVDGREVTVSAQVSSDVGSIDSVTVNWDSGSILNPWSGQSADMQYTGGGTYELTIPTSGTFDWNENVEIGIEATDEYGSTTETETKTVTTESNDPPTIQSVDTDVDEREITVTAEVSEGTGSITDVYANWDSGSFLNPWSGQSAKMQHTGGGTYELTIPTSGTFDWNENVEIGIEATDEYGSTTESNTVTRTTAKNHPPSIANIQTNVDDRRITVTVDVSEGTGSVTDVYVNWDSGSILNPWSGQSARMNHIGGTTYRLTIPEDAPFAWGADVELGIEATDEYGSTTESNTRTESIQDDTTPPDIQHVETTYDGTTVEITADVSDDVSGVDDVKLHYSTGWTDLFGSTEQLTHVGGNTYEATIQLDYGDRYSFEITATDDAGNTDSTSDFEEEVPRGTANVQITNDDDEAKDVTVYIDGSQADSLSIPAKGTRTTELSADPGTRTIEIEYEEADLNGQTFTQSTTASIIQQDSVSVGLTIPERLAPVLAVDCQPCDLGTYDYDDPPTIRIDIQNQGAGDLEWDVSGPMFDIVEQGADYVLLEPVDHGAYEHDVTISVLNDRTDGDRYKTLTITGNATVEASPPTVRWSRLPNEHVVAGDGINVSVHGEAGSAGTSDQPDPAPAADLEYVWYVNGDEVARTTTPEDRDIGSAAATEISFDDPGEHEVHVEVVDPYTDQSSTTDTKTVTVGEPDGIIKRYDTPEEGSVYELDTWYDVEVVVENTGNVTQTYDVEADVPSGTEVKEKTKRITLDPGEQTVVTFQQKFYGVNTATRAFSHDLYTVRFLPDDRVPVDENNVTMVQPEVGDLTVEFVDEHGTTIEADFEIYDESGEPVRDGRGTKVYRYFEAGDYTISADADGHHATSREFSLDADTERTLTVTVPTDTANATIETVELADDQPTYQRGDIVSVNATIRNIGDVEHTFFAGFSVRDEDAETYDNDGTTGQQITLAPDETQTVTLQWEVETIAIDGNYDIIVSTWWEDDSTQLRTRLDTHTQEDAVSVGTDSSLGASLEVGRTEMATGSKVAMRVVDAPQDADITWAIKDHPNQDAGDLLHTTEPHTTLTVDTEGTYVVTAVVETDTESQQLTTEIEVTDDEVEPLDTDAHQLAREYAPVLTFHPDEEFFPTRYEAYVENSVVATPTTVIEDPSLLDLRGMGGFSLINPQTFDDTKLLSFQDLDTYPRTVYTSVHENVTYEDEEYVALAYWLFYVNDPKPSDAGDLHKLAKHTGDQEKVFILINESGPQWIATQQHFGGEIRRWETVNTTNGHPQLWIGEGSHPTFFEPYGGAPSGGMLNAVPDDREFEKLYQEQYLTKWYLRTTPGGTDPHPSNFANQYTDPIRKGPVWTADGTEADAAYDIILLTEEMAWASYEGKVYTYPATSARGSVPQQSSVWDEPADWLTNEIGVSHEHYDATITVPATNTTPDLNRTGDSVTANLTLANVGPQSDIFVLNVTARHESGTVYSTEYGHAIGAGGITDEEYTPEPVDVSVPLFPETETPVESGNWSVTIELASYTADIRDREDVHAEREFAFEHESSVDATVAFVDTPSGDVEPGANVTSTVLVENTGGVEHEYFVGYAARVADGKAYDNNGTTGQTVTLEPGDSAEVTLNWTVTETVPEGAYDLVTAVWLESDRDALHTQLATDERDAVITVRETDVGQLTIETTPTDATIVIDDEPRAETTPLTVDLDAGDHTVTVDADGYQETTHAVTITAGETTTQHIELEPTPGEPTARVLVASDRIEQDETVTFDASASDDPQDSTLTYEWDLTGDGQFDDATGDVIEHQFDEPGTHTIAVRVSNDVGSDVQEVAVDVEPPSATFDIDTNLTETTSVMQNETVTVATELENHGGGTGTATVELIVDGATRTESTLTIEPGASRTVELQATLTEPGSRTLELTVTSNESTIHTSTHDIDVHSDDDGTTTPEDGVLASIQPPKTQVGVDSTTTASVTITDAPDGVGAFTTTISLGTARVGDITDIDVAGEPADIDITYTDDNNTVTIDAYGVDLTGDVMTLVEVTVEGQQPGSSQVDLNLDAIGTPTGESYDIAESSGGQIVVVALQPVGPFDNPPTDQNGDGKFRDVNGDSSADIVDVQALFANRGNQTIQNHPGKFDYNDDGDVDVVDVQRLFVEVTQEDSDDE